MPAGDYLAGLLAAAVTWGAAGYVSMTLERRLLPRMDGAPRFLALALLFLTALTAFHLVPGIAGILAPATVAITGAVLAVAVSRVPPAGSAREAAPTPSPYRDAGTLSRVCAVVAIGATAAFVLAGLADIRGVPPTHVDAVSFALPGVAEWIRSDSLFDIGAFFPFLQVRTYPNNGEVLALATILPWHNDAFLRLVAPLLVGAIVTAVYAVGQELRAPAPTAALAGVLAFSAATVAEPAFYAMKPDAYMAATFTAGVLFLLRHARTGARADLVLAGLGLGLAFGSRWYGISAGAIVLGVWLVASLVARKDRGVVVRDGLVLGITVLCAGGFWLVRNLVETGNPLYPVDLEVLGVTLLSAPRDFLLDDFGFSIADRLGQAGFPRHELAPAMWNAFGLPGVLTGVGCVVAVAFLVRGRRASPDWRVALLLVAASTLTVMYLFLPAGAQGLPDRPSAGIVEANARWLVPAFLLGVAAATWAAGRLDKLRPLVEIGMLACALYALGDAFSVPAAKLVAAAVVVALAWWLAPRGWAAVTALWHGRRVALVAAVGVLALGVVAFGYAHQRAYNGSRYDDRSAIVDWVSANAPSGQRVGLAGHWSPAGFVPIYALFGERFENDVEYVAPIVRDQVRLYRSGPRFAEALREGGFDLLAVGTLEEPKLYGHPRTQRRLEHPPEERWATRAGYVEVARDDTYVLLRRPGT